MEYSHVRTAYRLVIQKKGAYMSYQAKAEGLAYAIIELVKTKVDDSLCYRHLIDNLYAYRIRAVNKTDKWDTGRIKDFCRWSVAALNSNKTEKEHVVPMAEIVNILLALDELTISKVHEVIDTYCTYCIVTQEEHQLLNKEFQRKMPKDFYDKDSKYFSDPWARYKKCKIKISDKSLQKSV